MIRLGLTGYLKTFRKPELQKFLVEDFTNPTILDDFQPVPKGGYARAYGLIFSLIYGRAMFPGSQFGA